MMLARSVRSSRSDAPALFWRDAPNGGLGHLV